MPELNSAISSTAAARRFPRTDRLWGPPMLTNRLPRVAGFLFLAVLGGCAVGPNYRPPTAPVPAVFREEAATTNSLAELPWWDIYQDPSLRDLIRQAFTNNYDLRIAVSRVEQARAVAVQARSVFFPQIGYLGEAARGRQSFLGNAVPSGAQQGNPTKSSFLAEFNAAWEVDLFGRLRRGNEVVRAQYLATEEARRGVTLVVLSEVAQAYFELLELDQLLIIARRTTNSFGDTLKVFEERLQGGVASRLEASRAQASLASAEATIPELLRKPDQPAPRPVARTGPARSRHARSIHSAGRARRPSIGSPAAPA
jgi:outer membrane protein, multidrug efflux system